MESSKNHAHNLWQHMNQMPKFSLQHPPTKYQDVIVGAGSQEIYQQPQHQS